MAAKTVIEMSDIRIDAARMVRESATSGHWDGLDADAAVSAYDAYIDEVVTDETWYGEAHDPEVIERIATDVLDEDAIARMCGAMWMRLSDANRREAMTALSRSIYGAEG